MSHPQTASMKDALAKIPDLHRHQAKFAGSNYTTRFMRYVTDPAPGYFRETDTVFAETYLQAIFTALNDVPAGINSVGGSPPENYIGGFPRQMFMLIQRDIPLVAELIFPPEFAAEVKDSYEAMKSVFAPTERRAG